MSPLGVLGLDYNTAVVILGTGLLGLASGIIGAFAVLRRRALIGDALAHAALPGICLAFLITGERTFLWLLTGAFLSGLLGVGVVSLLRHYTRTKEDAAIGIVLSVFFGVGIALSRIIQNLGTEGSKAGLDTFIFGKTAGMLLQDIYAITALVVLVVAVVALLYKEFKLVSFDPEFAAVQGWPTLKLDLCLMGLLALTAVVGLPAVGVVLMAAMLIIPGAAARFWAVRLGPLLWLSGAFGLLTGILGTLISARLGDLVGGPDLPTGPVIVLTGTALFGVSLLFAPRRGALARWIEHLRLSRKVAEQNLLRTAYELNEPFLPRRVPFRLEDLLRRRAWSAGRARWLLARAAARGRVRPTGSGTYELTEVGLERAAAVVRTHRLWELFLIEEAHLAPDHIDRDADAIEHVLPPALVKRLEEELRRARRLPAPGALPPSPHVLTREER